MTIIHLSSSLGGGGAEQMVFQLSKLSRPKDKTIVISVSSVNTLEQKFVDSGIECHFLNITSFKNASLFKGLEKLHSIINNEKDIVFHCHQYHGYLLSVFYKLKYFKRIPTVFTLHSSTIEKFNRKLVLFLTQIFRNKDIVFSKNAKKWYLKNSKIIPNGVDFNDLSLKNQRTYNSSKPFSFLFLGRLSKEKNPLIMVTVAKKLLENNISNFIFNVVGEGNLKEALSNGIAANNLKIHFNLLGFQSNVKAFLEQSDCLILPSFWEGMPMVIIEAAAAKLPIVATPVGSIPDFLSSNNAFLSNHDTFYESMISVINNYEQALKKSEILYEEMKHQFHIENVYNKHLKVYKSIL